MIKVRAIVGESGAGTCEVLRSSGRHRIEVPVRSVERSIRFYRRVLGFHAIDSIVESPTIAVAPNAELVLIDRASTGREISAQAPSWSFLVTDLETDRGELWGLGVKVARDTSAPRSDLSRDQHVDAAHE